MLNERQFQVYDNLIKQVYQNLDLEQFRSIVLEHLSLLVPHDSAAFFLVSPETHRFLEPYCIGLDNNHFLHYQGYYEDKDIYKRAVFSGNTIPPVDRSTDYMDYTEWAKNEHRSDFLLPQGIYHLSCLQVINGGHLVGEISLHRSAGSPDFSDEEINILKMLHGHVNNAFMNISLIRRDFSSKVIEGKDRDNEVGLCILDSKYELITANGPARGVLIQRLSTGQNVYSHLKEICYGLTMDRKYRPVTGKYFKKGFLHCKDGKRFFRTIILEDEEAKNGITFLIIIEAGKNTESEIDRELAGRFELTRREIEIAALVARGKTNAEIARQLFLSENTVKTHIKNIFAKTGASCRAELAYNLFGPEAGSLKNTLNEFRWQ